MKLGAIILFAVALTAGKPVPSLDEQRETAIKARMEMVLKDPESARYKFGPLECVRVTSGTEPGGKELWAGVAQKFLVNAKNSFGGYSGWSAFATLWVGQGPEIHQLLSPEDIAHQRIYLNFVPCVSK
ncbi:hypothetical protein sos41_31680 [Alphaproteobacteria bacterium SO-S41]|nr:hypothetical protein sos41_31680 [Alphaproteobacteria bacterium SO-S41]